MTELSEQKCTACRPGSPRVDPQEVELLLAQIPTWQVVEEQGIQKLTRRFHTQNYQNTMRLVNQIAELANTEDHHPTLLVEYGAVTVWWWTHAIGGLHRNDFILAARTDKLLDQRQE
mgnify:CR=1 FL=1